MNSTVKSLFLTVFSILLFCGCVPDENSSGKKQENITHISALQADGIINEYSNDPDFIILDIRTPREYEYGHIAGAVNIDFYALDFEQQLDSLDKNKTYLIYCRSGSRTSIAMRIIKQLGFRKVYNMVRGTIDWQQNKLPLTK